MRKFLRIRFDSISIPFEEVDKMPEDILDAEKFIALSEHAEECRVRRSEDVVKLKLRTVRKLYVLKLDPAKAEDIIKRLKCEVVDV